MTFEIIILFLPFPVFAVRKLMFLPAVAPCIDASEFGSHTRAFFPVPTWMASAIPMVFTSGDQGPTFAGVT